MALALWRKQLLRFRLAGWELSLSLIPILALLLLFPLLIKLGIWQLDRAAQRQQALDTVETIRQGPHVPATDSRLNDADERYIRIQIEGNIDWSRQFLLDNQVHNTVAGYEVLTPVVFAPGRAMLLSRGWLPPTLGKKPDLSPPKPFSSESTLVTGLAVVPPPRLTATQKMIMASRTTPSTAVDVAGDVDWPVLIQEEDFAKMSELLGLELVPRVLQPDAIDFGYSRVWQPVRRGPAVNYGYAAQWFGMALLLLGCVIRFNLSRSPHAGTAAEN